MNTLHLTEEEIQLYALDIADSPQFVIEHAATCDACKTKVQEYQLLFSGIKEQPASQFDFDLTGLVVAGLPASTSRSSPDNFFMYVFISVAIIITGIAAYYFRGYISGLFVSIAPVLIYLILTTVFTLAIILGLDMYKNYQKKMKALEFY